MNYIKHDNFFVCAYGRYHPNLDTEMSDELIETFVYSKQLFTPFNSIYEELYK